jgi:pimeloyl-ACP methyl ester carboxylesterase
MNVKRIIKITLPVFVLVIIYLLGPAPHKPNYSTAMPMVPVAPVALEKYIDDQEHKHLVKANNEARIVWADSSKQQTEYSIVYLHGYSASQMEGDPVHRRFAREFGCNLYLSRLADHGIDTTETLLYFSADRLWESAKEALAIGNVIGKKVILMSTSTGGTVALMLAAQYPEKVHALINLSPNIAINDPAAFLLNDPWGLQIARAVLGGKYRDTESTQDEEKYWNDKYRIESIVQLEELLESGMTSETFHKVHQPSLTLYYYVNEKEQDPQVKVSAMLKMNEELGTPDSLKVAKAIPGAGHHVIGGSLKSKDVEGVYRAIREFAVKQLHLRPASDFANTIAN